MLPSDPWNPLHFAEILLVCLDGLKLFTHARRPSNMPGVETQIALEHKASHPFGGFRRSGWNNLGLSPCFKKRG